MNSKSLTSYMLIFLFCIQTLWLVNIIPQTYSNKIQSENSPEMIGTPITAGISEDFEPYSYLSSSDSPFGICQYGYDPVSNRLMHNINFSWLRQDFDWSHIEPNNNTWNFAYYDNIVQIANTEGFYILPLLDYTVKWAMAPAYPDNPDARVLPPYLDDWLDFVRTTVQRYRGNQCIVAWEIWNEPNLDGFWQDSTENFLVLFTASAKIIRDEDPTSLILYGGTSNVHDGLHNQNNQEYYDYIFQLNATESSKIYGQLDFDVVNFHPYSNNEREYESVIRAMQDVCDKWHFDWRNKKQLWITEFGWQTRENDTIDHTVYAIRMVKCFTIGMQMGVRKSIMYRWRGCDDNYGLLMCNSTPKMAYYALEQSTPLMSHHTPCNNLIQYTIPLTAGSMRIYAFKHINRNEYTLALWTDDNKLLSFDLEISEASVLNSELSEILQSNIDLTNQWSKQGQISHLSRIVLSSVPVFITLTTDVSLAKINVVIQPSIGYILFWVMIPIISLIGIGLWLIQKRSPNQLP